jgi:cytochrome P450
VLDIQRADNKHISFGSGAHYCLGAPLARLEAQITFEILAQRLPSMQLVNPDPEFLPNLRMRSVTSLPIRVTP